jgi:hypothetical protein
MLTKLNYIKGTVLKSERNLKYTFFCFIIKTLIHLFCAFYIIKVLFKFGVEVSVAESIVNESLVLKALIFLKTQTTEKVR